MKERKREMIGEVLPPAGGVMKGECSRHPLLDHNTVVRRVSDQLTCKFTLVAFGEYFK